MSKRIGPRMAAILSYVQNNPACSILEAAMATRGRYNEGHRYGYAAAHRLLRAGLLCNRAPRGSATYQLFVCGRGLQKTT